MAVILQESGWRLLQEDGGALVQDTTAQDLGLSLFSDPDSFGAVVVEAFGQITLALFTDPDSFGAATIIPGPVTLTASLYADPDDFPAFTVENAPITLTATLFVDADSFGTVSVQPGPVTLTLTRLDSNNVFFEHRIIGVISLVGTAAGVSSVTADLTRYAAIRMLAARGIGATDGQTNSYGRLNVSSKTYTPKYSKPIRFISILDNLMRR